MAAAQRKPILKAPRAGQSAGDTRSVKISSILKTRVFLKDEPPQVDREAGFDFKEVTSVLDSH